MFYAQDMNEHVANLDIYNKTPQVIYSVQISQLKKNDVVQVTAELEATNNHGYNAMIGCEIILSNNESDTDGELIDQANAFNISQNMHHGVVSKTRNWISKSDYYNKHINVVCWSTCVNSFLGDMLKIEKGYGHLDVVIYSLNALGGKK